MLTLSGLGRPTTGPVQVVRGHRFAKGLLSCLLLTEGSGRAVRNLGSHAEPGLAVKPLWTGAPDGYAAKFSGSADSRYIGIPRGGGLSGVQTLTIFLRARWIGTQGAQGAVLGRQLNGSFSDHIIRLNGNNPATAVFQFAPVDGSNFVSGTTAVGDGRWRDLIVTHRSGAQAVYLDSVQEGTAAFSGTITSNQTPVLSIGAWIDDGASWMTGEVADMRAWDWVFTAQDVRDFLANRHGMFQRPALARYWQPANTLLAASAGLAFTDSGSLSVPKFLAGAADLTVSATGGLSVPKLFTARASLIVSAVADLALPGIVEDLFPVTALATHSVEDAFPVVSDLLSVVCVEDRMPVEGDYATVEDLMPVSPADLEGLRFERRTRPVAESVFA